MTNSPVERMINGLVTFLSATFPTYIARANSGYTTTAKNPKVYEHRDTLPDKGAFPFVAVEYKDSEIDATGQNCQRITVDAGIYVFVNEPNIETRKTVLVRYTDALIDMIGENETLGGIAGLAYLQVVDSYATPSDGNGTVAAAIRMEMEIQT